MSSSAARSVVLNQLRTRATAVHNRSSSINQILRHVVFSSSATTVNKRFFSQQQQQTLLAAAATSTTVPSPTPTPSSSSTTTTTTTATHGSEQEAAAATAIQRLIQKQRGKNFRKNTLLFVLAFLLIVSTFTTPEQRANLIELLYSDEDTLDHTLSNMILEQFIRDGVVGGTFCVIRDGKIIYHKSYGYSDLENSSPMQVNHKMRIASISKSMSATILGMLVDEGLVEWDEPVYKYLMTAEDEHDESDKRGFAAKLDPRITVRMLASHLSGIRNYKSAAATEDVANDSEFLSSQHFDSVADSLTMFINDQLEHEPGSKYLYSTFGYTLLGYLIECLDKKNGTTLANTMKERLFDKLGMNDTCADDNSTLIKNRSRFYRRTEKQGLINAPHVDLSNKLAGGGLLSTALDVCMFGSALVDHAPNKIVSDQTRLELFTEQQVPLNRLRTPSPVIATESYNKNKNNNVEQHTPVAEKEPLSNIKEEPTQEGSETTEPSSVDNIAEQHASNEQEPIVVEQPNTNTTTPVQNEQEDTHIVTSPLNPPLPTSGTGYGLGFTVGQDSIPYRKNRVQVVSHSGGAVGASSVLYMIPEERLVVSVLVNTENVKLTPLAALMAKETVKYLDKEKVYN